MITIRPKAGDPTRGILGFDKITVPCALGRSGMSITKREGNGATPILTTRPLYGFYRQDRGPKPRSGLPFTPTRPSMGWCDDPKSPNYNRAVTLPYSASAEHLWREDCLYDIILVLDINITSRIKGNGSALFMHVARPIYKPTEGCVGLKKSDLFRLLPFLSPQTRIRISP